ncbi:MAG: FAD-binding oxidoreductase [Hyphomicrobiales bacterium]|nr:FAD-binding oxidoreductase [Hyphomicrobiales bacterium]
MDMDVPDTIGTAIIGGGLIGTCLALFLAEEGRDVAVFDDGRVGGSTANAGSLHVQMQSRFMRLYPDQVPALEEGLHLYPKAVAFWRDLEAELEADFELRMTGGLMVAEDADQLAFLAAKVERERALGVESEIVERDELGRIAPYLGPAVVGAELCPMEGKINPLFANAALRRTAVEKGAAFFDRTPVDGISRERAWWHVNTLHGTVSAGALVLAAGSGTKALAASIGVPVPVAAEPLHMNITEATGPLITHLVQHADRPITMKQLGAGQVVIGGGWPARQAGPMHHPTVELESLIGNVALGGHIVPAVSELNVIRCWAGLNTTGDGKGILGAVESEPGLFVAVPGDAGYTLGPLSARLVADVMLGREATEDLSPFSPSRFG